MCYVEVKPFVIFSTKKILPAVRKDVGLHSKKHGHMPIIVP